MLIEGNKRKPCTMTHDTRKMKMRKSDYNF